jgi:PhzF family phenazine biosynthesis protein
VNRRFQLVDVFNDQPFSGNPLAVVFDADDIDAPDMQRITRWCNLSETAFLLPTTTQHADYRVRIFTLAGELPFAGHPTLGSCHAWLTGGGQPRGADVIQECGAGLIPIRRMEQSLAFAAPPLIRSGPVDAAKLAEIAQFLRIGPSAILDSQWADNGPGWILVLLESAAAVLALEPARDHPARLDLGVIGPYAGGGAFAFELRAFFTDPHGSVIEDPVTGSLNAGAAQWLLATHRAAAPYICSQGTRLGRTGRIAISQDPQGRVWVGGRSKTLFSGTCAF